jgi:RimJ/RimL family protein N-acetyltransferase
MNRPSEQPTLETARLRLRPLRPTDAPRIREYAGDLRVAEMTSLIPHPYPEHAAEEWIVRCTAGDDIAFAIARRETDELVGAIGVHPEPNGLIAEIGFWIGVPFWGRGYCTEAAREILRFCFEDLGLQRVHAGHFAGNEASGRVQEKIGMRREGFSPWSICRFGALKDRVIHGIIRPDWEALQGQPGGGGD